MKNQYQSDNTQENYLKNELYQLVKTDESIFDFIQESSLDGIWYWDLETPENEWMSPRFWTVLGYDPQEMPHKSNAWQGIINPDDLKVALDNFNKHCNDPKHPFDQEVRYKHKNGSTVWIRCRGLAIRDRSGKPLRMLGAHHVITKLKQAEERLTQEHILLRTIINRIPDAIYAKDTKTRKTLSNQADYTNCGLTREEDVLGRTDFEVFPQEIAEHFFSDDQKILQQEEKLIHQLEKLQRKTGETKWLMTTKLPLHNKDGDIIGIVGIGRDITQQKQAEEKLRLSEITYREILNAIEDALFMLDINTGDILDVNDTMLRMYGYSREEISGLSLADISARVAPYNDEMSSYYIRKASEGETVTFEWYNRRKNGSLFFSENILKYVEIAGQERIMAIVRDITQRKFNEEKMEEMLKETSRMNRLMSGREDRILELKRQVNTLSLQLNQEIVYQSVEEEL
jgi:PAS domain S-box-containing protein